MCVCNECGSGMSGIIIKEKFTKKVMIVQDIDNIVQKPVTVTRLKKEKY